MNTKDIYAAVLHQRNAPYAIQRIEFGNLEPDELLIENIASGICHTDFIAENLVPLPAVFGHEGYGSVVEVGASVTGLQKGDRVIISYPMCGCCNGCMSGQPFLCDHHMDLAFKGSRLNGTSTTTSAYKTISTSFFQQSSFATHSVVQAKNVVKVNCDLPAETLAAIPCGVQTGAGAVINTFKAGPLTSIAVFGTGAVGLSAIMAAKIAGLYPIIGVDINDSRLELARELGADYVFNAADDDIEKQIVALTKGGCKFSLETSGNEKALNTAISTLATGGVCGMVISPHFGQKYPFSPTEIFKGGKSLCGIIQGSSVPSLFLPRLIEWIEAGRFPVDRMIQTYRFEDINTATADTRSGKVVKAVLTMK